MLSSLPIYIPIVFGLTSLLTLVLFHRTYKDHFARPNWILGGIILWMILQAGLSLSSFYTTNTMAIPPKFPLVVMPPFLLIAILFLSKKGRKFIDRLPLERLHWIHTVRIPVEIVLYGLFVQKTIPEVMTFAGRNFDIIAGLSVPFVIYFGLRRQQISRSLILSWNFLSLGLLLNIVVHAVLALPSAFQQIAFDQPNQAILYFPFIWLPAFVVQVVLFSHLASIRQLLRGDKNATSS